MNTQIMVTRTGRTGCGRRTRVSRRNVLRGLTGGALLAAVPVEAALTLPKLTPDQVAAKAFAVGEHRGRQLRDELKIPAGHSAADDQQNDELFTAVMDHCRGGIHEIDMARDIVPVQVLPLSIRTSDGARLMMMDVDSHDNTFLLTYVAHVGALLYLMPPGSTFQETPPAGKAEAEAWHITRSFSVGFARGFLFGENPPMLVL